MHTSWESAVQYTRDDGYGFPDETIEQVCSRLGKDPNLLIGHALLELSRQVEVLLSVVDPAKRAERQKKEEAEQWSRDLRKFCEKLQRVENIKISAFLAEHVSTYKMLPYALSKIKRTFCRQINTTIKNWPGSKLDLEAARTIELNLPDRLAKDGTKTQASYELFLAGMKQNDGSPRGEMVAGAT